MLTSCYSVLCRNLLTFLHFKPYFYTVVTLSSAFLLDFEIFSLLLFLFWNGSPPVMALCGRRILLAVRIYGADFGRYMWSRGLCATANRCRGRQGCQRRGASSVAPPATSYVLCFISPFASFVSSFYFNFVGLPQRVSLFSASFCKFVIPHSRQLSVRFSAISLHFCFSNDSCFVQWRCFCVRLIKPSQ